MAFVAVATMGGAALIGGGASIYGGIQQAGAAKEGAAAQQDAINMAQQTTIAGGRDALAYLDPFRQFGLNAGTSLQDMLYSTEQRKQQIDSQRMQLQGEVDRLKGLAPKWDTYQLLTGKNASERRASMFTQENQIAQQKIKEAQAKLATFEQQVPGMLAQAEKGGAQIQESPWYQFQAELLGRTQDRAMAARGLTGSGFEAEERRRGLIELGAGETERQFGRLKGLYDVGAQTASQGANVLTNTANNLANQQIGIGQAQAQGLAGVANANAGMAAGVGNAVTGAVGAGLNYAQFQNLIESNQRMSPVSVRSSASGAVSSFGRGKNGFMVNTPGY